MRTSSGGGSCHRKGSVIRVHFVTHRPDALQALRERCRESPGFRRLLQAAAHDLVRRGRPRPVLSGNSPAAARALERAVNAFSNAHRAWVPEGAAAAWNYLAPELHKAGGKTYRVLTRLSEAEALCLMRQEARLDGFTVRRLLGYAPDISWQAAASLNRVHGPPAFYLAPESEEPRDEAFDLDPNENEHFRDDRGFYDGAGVLRPPREAPESWEGGYATREEAWNRMRRAEYRVPAPTRFFPAPAAEPLNLGLERAKARWRIDHHGVAELLRDRAHRQRCQRELEHLRARQQMARALPEAPLYHADLKRVRQNLLEREQLITLGRRAELDADEEEVLAHAELDVPETILELLEQQVEETAGKAPRGLVAALAQARLEARERAECARRYLRGLAALGKAASQQGPQATA